jgi:hypothetical protein
LRQQAAARLPGWFAALAHGQAGDAMMETGMADGETGSWINHHCGYHRCCYSSIISTITTITIITIIIIAITIINDIICCR